MSDFRRYAIYYVPDDRAFMDFGASWLGWDSATGRAVSQPNVDDIETITKTPRKYGFHGTLKPPFRLADGTFADTLQRDLAEFSAQAAPVKVDAMSVSAIGKFVAVVPQGNTDDLAHLAFECVKTFDTHRRPASTAELARRRAKGLSPREEALLLEWGYPYVDDAFRFHLTLTGPLEEPERARAIAAAQALLPPLPKPFTISSVCLAGEAEDGHFHLIHRYALAG